jgi:hypothetical protein
MRSSRNGGALAFDIRALVPLLVVALAVPLLAAAVWSFKPAINAETNVAALTESQILSILGILSAFGVQANVISDVELALRGETPTVMLGPIATSSEPIIEVPPPDTSITPTGLVTVSVAPWTNSFLVPSGTTYVLTGLFTFDATNTTEDVNFLKLSFLYTDNALYDPYNCAIYSGPTEYMKRYTKATFNPDWVHPAGTGEKVFTLDNQALVLSKGTTKQIEIRCYTNTIAYKGTGSFSWGLSSTDGKATFSGVGVTSGEVITPTIVPSIGTTLEFISQSSSRGGLAGALDALRTRWSR